MFLASLGIFDVPEIAQAINNPDPEEPQQAQQAIGSIAANGDEY